MITVTISSDTAGELADALRSLREHFRTECVAPAEGTEGFEEKLTEALRKYQEAASC